MILKNWSKIYISEEKEKLDSYQEMMKFWPRQKPGDEPGLKDRESIGQSQRQSQSQSQSQS